MEQYITFYIILCFIPKLNTNISINFGAFSHSLLFHLLFIFPQTSCIPPPKEKHSNAILCCFCGELDAIAAIRCDQLQIKCKEK